MLQRSCDNFSQLAAKISRPSDKFPMLEQWARTRMPLNSGPGIRVCVTNLAMSVCIGIVKELRSITHITHEEQSQKVTGCTHPGRERTTKDQTIAGVLMQILKLIVFVCNCMKVFVD